jgi:nicotinamidase/pyrazinamidase
MRALLLTDIQNDFLPGGALPVPGGDTIIPIANVLQPHFPLLVATQDWHPPHHASFAANHPGKNVYDQIDLCGLPQTLWPVHCVQNTPGADLAPALHRDRINHISRKGTDPFIDSYSAFFDNGHRRSTGLADWLRSHQVSDLYLCGLATDYCVKFSALDALAQGFRVFVIEDACRGIDLQPGDVAQAIELLRRSDVTILRSDQLNR